MHTQRSYSNPGPLWTAGLLGALVVVLLLPARLLDFDFGTNYLPLHMTTEILLIALGAAIFSVVWGARFALLQSRLLIVGMAALGSAALGMLHMVSYPGMPIFVTASGTEKAIAFWLQRQYLLAAGLVLAAWMPPTLDRILSRQSKYTFLTVVAIIVAVGGIWQLYFPSTVPATFAPGTGLTPFKIGAEYVLIFFLLVAAAGFYLHPASDKSARFSNLTAAATIFAMGEVYFTLYNSATDAYNLIGHLYNILGYYFVYRAVFKQLLKQPFLALTEARANMQATIEMLPDRLVELDIKGNLISLHSQDEKLALGAGLGEIRPGMTVHDILPEEACETILLGLQTALMVGSKRDVHITLHDPEKDKERYFDLAISRKRTRDAATSTVTFLMLARDITATIEQQQRLELEARANLMLVELDEHTHGQKEHVFIDTVLHDVMTLTHSDRSCLYLQDERGHQSSVINHVRTHCVKTSGLEWPDLWDWFEKANGRHTLNLTKDSAERPAGCTNEFFGNLLAIPVYAEGFLKMVLAVGGKDKPYRESEVNILERIAKTVWAGVIQRRQEVLIRNLSFALGQSPYAVLITDTSLNIEYVNEAFTHLSGYKADEIIGKTPRILKSGKTSAETYDAMWKNLNQGRTWQGELVNRRKDGSVYNEKVMIYPIRSRFNKVTHYVAHKEDITAERETELRIHQLSNYDQMTGLINRQVLEASLDRLVKQASRSEQPLTVLWLDIDNFKTINDTLGHDAGNLLLIEISSRLRQVLGSQTILARTSGNGFVAVLTDSDQNMASLIAQQLLEVVQQPATLHGRQIIVTASIGLSIYPADATNVIGLLMNAETAMYQVKAEGRNNMRFFSHDMQNDSVRALELSSALKQIDMDEQFHMVYQPQLCLKTGRFIGTEALLRWRHPEWGLVSPAEFIPIAEQSGRILDIGHWVLQHVSWQLQQWRKGGLGEFTVAVNLSALQFLQDHLVEHMIQTVTSLGLPTSSIEVELTETVALDNPLAAGQTINALRQAGFRVAIDDFGTGYSSMSYLKRFAIDKLKIDRSFISDLNVSTDDQAIVKAIIQMARTLGMETIAEGVETRDQLELLKRNGCDAIQGYYYAKPMPATEFEKFVRDHR